MHAQAPQSVARNSPVTPLTRRLRVLHVVIQAGPTNSQWNEHCLPVADQRQITVCSLFPATVAGDPRIERVEADGSVRGSLALLRRVLRDGAYDVVHVHSPSSAVLLLLACFLERRGRDGLVFTLHTSWPLLSRRNRWLARLTVATYPCVVACGRASAESIPARLRHRLGDRLQVVPNGFDVDRVDRALSRPLPTDFLNDGTGFTFISVGRLIPVKDHATAIRAFARISRRQDRLVLVGEGPLRGELESLARDLFVEDRVEISGLVPRDDVYRLLGRADAFVSPSVGEGLPVSVLEAMAAGLPVLLSDIPAHREIAQVTDGALMARTGEVRAFAEAMRAMQMASARRLTELSTRSRRSVVRHFSLDVMSDGYDAVYRRVATREPQPELRRVSGVDRNPPAKAEGVPVSQNMDLSEVSNGIKRRAWLVVAFAAIGAVVGYWLAATVPVVYRAQATLLVGPTNGSVTHSSTVNASEQLASFYADMARRQLVLEPVVQQLQLPFGWAALRNHVSAQVPPQNPRLVTVTTIGGSQRATERWANAITHQIVSLSPAPPGGNEQNFINQQVEDLKHSIEGAQQRVRDLQSRLVAAQDSDTKASLKGQIDDEQALVGEWQSTYVDLVGVDPTAEAGELQPLDAATPVTDDSRSGAAKLIMLGGVGGGVIGVMLAWLLHRRQARRQARRAAKASLAAPAAEEKEPLTAMEEAPRGETADHEAPDHEAPDHEHRPVVTGMGQIPRPVDAGRSGSANGKTNGKVNGSVRRNGRTIRAKGPSPSRRQVAAQRRGTR